MISEVNEKNPKVITTSHALVHPCWNHLEGLLRHRFLGPVSRVPDSGGLGWGWRICISDNFQVPVDAEGLVTTLLELLFYIKDGIRSKQGIEKLTELHSQDELSEAIMERGEKVIPNAPSVFPMGVPFSLSIPSDTDMLVEFL